MGLVNPILTCSQFAAMVQKLLGYPESVPTDFSDIDAKDWFSGEAGSLIQKHIMTGKEEGIFAPNNPVSWKRGHKPWLHCVSLRLICSDP